MFNKTHQSEPFWCIATDKRVELERAIANHIETTNSIMDPVHQAFK